MRFFFRIQLLLNWKRNLEESSQIRLAEKISLVKAQEEKIQQLREQRLGIDRELTEKIVNGMKADEYFLYQQFVEESYIDLLQKESEKRQTEGEVEKEREQLIALMKERKVLERLKEKRYKTFIHQMEKLDQKNMDELIISRRSSVGKETL
ncbi:MAG: flagellar export protein FliJ [Deltaproteobacteria bacterium]|nr:flagellar export protein FliJ [Deltaproteobacteria bacterium]